MEYDCPPQEVPNDKWKYWDGNSYSYMNTSSNDINFHCIKSGKENINHI